MYQKSKKIVASIIVFIILMANLSTVGININRVIAADINSQNAKTNNSNVEFNTYFMSENKKTYESTKNIGEENKIAVEVAVKNAGYLKNTVIEFLDSNFQISNSETAKEEIISQIEKNKISLKQVNAGEEQKIEMPIEFKNSESYNPNQLNQVNKVKMTGTYVDEKGKTHNVKKEISLGLNWSANAETILEAQITKYVPYQIKEEKGLIVQLAVKSGIKQNTLPIKNTKLEVEIPSINTIAPKDIKITANSTKASNGEENGLNFGENNYKIEENKITINVENTPDENGSISWKKEAQDEYIITLIYGEEALSAQDTQNTQVQLNIKSNIQTYSIEQTNIEANFQNTFEMQNQLGNIVDYEIASNENISKGQIYANYDASQKQEIEYNQKITANIGLAQLTDEIIIKQEADKFRTQTAEASTTIANNNYAYYKNIQISKEAFSKILGEEGFIKIYVGEEEKLSVDKNTAENEQGKLEINLSELNINNITIKTSKPQTEGKLELEITKAIKGEIAYQKEQVQEFIELASSINAQAISSQIVLVEQNAEATIKLIEPQTQVEIQTNTQELSTIVKNENVEIRAILNTSTNYNKLFKNPKIILELPSYMEQIDIKNVQLLYEDELTVEQANSIVEPDGTKKIELSLKGTQTKYSKDALTKGTNLLITADITANNLTPNTIVPVKLTVINENEVAQAEVPIKFIAPVGIVTANKLTNTVNGAQIMALTNDEKAPLEVTTTAKPITAEIQIINNYENKIKNIKVLGRTLTKGATDPETMQNLNNTFDAPMTSPINTNGLENVIIYYSQNGNATADLQNAENGWTQEIQDYSTVKSYLIILNEYEMEVGNSIKFTYNAQIPENLNYSQTVNSMYTVYFDNIQEEQTINDRVKSRIVTLSTGEAPNLEVKLESEIAENAVVREGQYLKFKATVKNTGTVNAENVTLNITAPNGKIYTYRDSEGNVQFTEDTSLIEDTQKQLIAVYETVHTQYVSESFQTGYEDSEDPEKVIQLGTIEGGKTAEAEYEIKLVYTQVYKSSAMIDKDSNLAIPEVILNNKVRVNADDMQKPVESNIYKLKFEKGYAKLLLETDKEPDYTLIENDELTYETNVETPSDRELKNVIIKVQVPKGLEIKETTIENQKVSTDEEIQYSVNTDKQKNIVTYTIPTLLKNSDIKCIVKTQVTGEILGDIKAITTLKADDIEEHYSNTRTNTISKLEFEIKQLDPDKQYVKERETVTYTYEITNKSDVYTSDFYLEHKITEGMQLSNATVTTNGNTSAMTVQNKDGAYVFKFPSFKANAKAVVNITMEAEVLPNGETEKEVTSYATIYGKNFETKTSNSVKTTIEYNEEIHKVDYGNNEPPKDDGRRYKISGLAWLDKNQNGKRDEEEELLAGIEVRLLNKNTNEIVKDIDTATEKIVKTSSTGEYTFTNLERGEYLVVFMYNQYKYELTQYQKSGINNTVNSDVTSIDMTIDGKQTKVAITDTLRVTDENIRNVDMGLCESEKSDMKLEKYISAITVTYGNTVKKYSYDNQKIAKVEIPAAQLSNATVIVEYKIIVTNEGAIGNYVRKVVDYMPKDMKFNSELNRDWYQSSNGDIYNSSLANKKLESGESAELSLTLTKKMTDKNTGIVNNNAELYEVYNEEGKQDIDSTPANKVTSEDDISAADVVIGVKTGDAVTYTALISVVICITIGISAYYIRKKVLRRM